MYHRRYLNLNAEALALGLRSGTLGAVFSTIYVLYTQPDLNFIMALIGVFVASLIETVALKSSTKDQIKYTLIISIGAGITLALGSMAGHKPIILSLGILVLLLPVGLSAGSSLLTATTILFIANQFIIGSGLPATAHDALIYGIYFFAGGFALVISRCIQYIFFNNIYDHQNKSDEENQKIFTINSINLKFALKLSVAVCIANAIAGYLKLPQQYCAPMTALLLLRIDHETSIERVNHRLFGTLIGSILAGLLIVVIQDKLILALLMFPVLFLIVISMAKHYGAYVFFLTAMVTILFNLIESGGIMVTVERVLFTLLGISSVVVVIYLSKWLSRS